MVFDKRTEQFLSLDQNIGDQSQILKGESGLIVKDKQGNFWMVVNDVLTRSSWTTAFSQTKKVAEDSIIPVGTTDVCDDKNGRYLWLENKYAPRSKGF